MEIARAVKVLAASVLPALVVLAPTQISANGENMPAVVASGTAGTVSVMDEGPDDGAWP
jgi:hypothetical protein